MNKAQRSHPTEPRNREVRGGGERQTHRQTERTLCKLVTSWNLTEMNHTVALGNRHSPTKQRCGTDTAQRSNAVEQTQPNEAMQQNCGADTAQRSNTVEQTAQRSNAVEQQTQPNEANASELGNRHSPTKQCIRTVEQTSQRRRTVEHSARQPCYRTPE